MYPPLRSIVIVYYLYISCSRRVRVKLMMDDNCPLHRYMAFGGTNFGFTNGQNVVGPHGEQVAEGGDARPDLTSYDYNAPVAEDGRNGVDETGVDKYVGFQEELRKRSKSPTVGIGAELPLPAFQKWGAEGAGDPFWNQLLGRGGAIGGSGAGGALFDKVAPAEYPAIELAVEDKSLRSGGECFDVPQGPGPAVDLRLHEMQVYDHVAVLRYSAPAREICDRTFRLDKVRDRVYVYAPFRLAGGAASSPDSPSRSPEIARFERGGDDDETPPSVTIASATSPACTDSSSDTLLHLDFLVESFGRSNFGESLTKDGKGFSLVSTPTKDASSPSGSWQVCNKLFHHLAATDERGDELQQPVGGSAAVTAFRTTKNQQQALWPGLDVQEGRSSPQGAKNVARGAANPAEQVQGAPFVWKGSFSLPTAAEGSSATSLFHDTHLDTRSLFGGENRGKGVIFVNGMNVGRYWNSMGPVFSLYVPGTFLKPGKNVVAVVEFEEESRAGERVALRSGSAMIIGEGAGVIGGFGKGAGGSGGGGGLGSGCLLCLVVGGLAAVVAVAVVLVAVLGCRGGRDDQSGSESAS